MVMRPRKCPPPQDAGTDSYSDSESLHFSAPPSRLCTWQRRQLLGCLFPPLLCTYRHMFIPVEMYGLALFCVCILDKTGSSLGSHSTSWMLSRPHLYGSTAHLWEGAHGGAGLHNQHPEANLTKINVTAAIFLCSSCGAGLERWHFRVWDTRIQKCVLSGMSPRVAMPKYAPTSTNTDFHTVIQTVDKVHWWMKSWPHCAVMCISLTSERPSRVP